MTIDPIAMPTEKIAMTRLATRSSAVRMFFTSGGKMMFSTAPIVKKKLIAQIDRNTTGICIVAPPRSHYTGKGERQSRREGNGFGGRVGVGVRSNRDTKVKEK